MGLSPSHIYGLNHDYVFYPADWSDLSSGDRYQKGYYDENGTRYDAIALKKNGVYESKLCCDYCGTEIKTKWTEGKSPECPNCGANLQEVLTNLVVDEELNDREYMETVMGMLPSKSYNPFMSVIKVILFIILGQFLLSIILGVAFNIIAPNLKNKENNVEYTRATTAASRELPEELYVKEIDRYCSWDGENYYDPVSDCYFWYNTDLATPTWQYWYEGISSDYGDYGWMEFDFSNHKWYIEESENNWVELPDKYDASELWHTRNSPYDDQS